MAIDRTGISSLEVGAPEITYTGDQGPKSPDQQLMASADPMLVEEYNKYVFEMEEQGMQPMSFKEFVQQIMSEANMAQGGIARLGYDMGGNIRQRPHTGSDLLAKKNSEGTRSKYQPPGRDYGGPPGGGATSRGSGRDVGGGSTQESRNLAHAQHETANRIVAQAQAQAVQEAAHRARLTEGDIGLRRLTAEQAAATEAFVPRLTAEQAAATEAFVPRLTAEQAAAMEDAYSPKPPMLGDTGGSMDYMGSTMPAHLGDTGGSMDYMLPPVVPTGDGGGDGGGDLIRLPTLPYIPIETDKPEDLETVREDAIAEAETKSGLPFEHYYVGGDPTAEQEKFMVRETNYWRNTWW